MTRKYYSMTSGGDSGKGAEKGKTFTVLMYGGHFVDTNTLAGEGGYFTNTPNLFKAGTTKEDIVATWKNVQHIMQTSDEDIKRVEKNLEDCLLVEVCLQPTQPKEGVEQAAEVKQFHAVEYSGFWNIQTSPFYEANNNILDAEFLGAEKAEYYANLIVKLLNEHLNNGK